MPPNAAFGVLHPVLLVLRRAVPRDRVAWRASSKHVSIVIRHENFEITERIMLVSHAEGNINYTYKLI